MSGRTVTPFKQIIQNFMRSIKDNGGIKGSLYSLLRTDEIKDGELVGVDKYGNKYYQNKRYFVGRSRWVIFAENYGWNYDASQIPAEWHGWMHYMTDQTPVTNPPTERKWMIKHEENPTGTKNIYVPYNTARAKIESWQPPKQ